LAELFTGYPIFPGENEIEQLACIMEVLGAPPENVIAHASRKRLFFGQFHLSHPGVAPPSGKQLDFLFLSPPAPSDLYLTRLIHAAVRPLRIPQIPKAIRAASPTARDASGSPDPRTWPAF
jgi:hypothetical protein